MQKKLCRYFCKIMYQMCRFIFLLYVSMVFSKDTFSAIYMEYIKGFVPIRYRGYRLCISPHLILIYLQARVFQQFYIFQHSLAMFCNPWILELSHIKALVSQKNCRPCLSAPVKKRRFIQAYQKSRMGTFASHTLRTS
jgi:hypothetical protein